MSEKLTQDVNIGTDPSMHVTELHKHFTQYTRLENFFNIPKLHTPLERERCKIQEFRNTR